MNELGPRISTSELPPPSRDRAPHTEARVPPGRAAETGVSLLADHCQTRQRPCGWALGGEAALAEAQGGH